MIVDAIFTVVEAILGFFEDAAQAALGLLPDIDAPDLAGLVAATAPVWEFVGYLNKYAPVDHALVGLGLWVTYWLVLYGVRFAIWLLTKAHVLGGT